VFVSVVNQHVNAVVDGLTTRLTLPENPLTLVTVTIVCLSEATGIAWNDGFSAIVKSPDDGAVTTIVTVMLCEIEPLAPVNVSVYVPVDVDDVVPTVNVKVAVPPGRRLTLVLLKVMVSPAGEDESVRLIVPLNPLRLETVTVETNEKPCVILKLLGLVVREKSGRGTPFTITDNRTVWNDVPLIPAMEARYVPEGVDTGAETVMVEIAV
jgi:hypothetical protein